MTALLGVGFLGFAHGNVALYAEVMRQFDDVRLVCGYDEDVLRGRMVCEKVGIRYCFRPEDVWDHPDVQAVVIGSETNRHAELAVAAAGAGRHILCQKPMALSLADCDRMIAAADRAGVSLGVAYQMRHDPCNIRMHEIVQSGDLGAIGVVRRRHGIGVLFSDAFIHGPTCWHLDSVKNKGMFMDDACHPADWFYWMLGRPVSVVAEIDNVLTRVAPDDNGVAVFRFARGEMGVLMNSATVMAAENTVEIYGEKGCLIQNYGDAPSCSVPKCPSGPVLKMFRYGERQWHTFDDLPVLDDHGHRIRAVPRPWIDSLLKGTGPAVDGRAGRVSVEMVLAAYRSSQEGRRIWFE